MISLSSEITDSKGRRARRGWLFFDRDCEFCVSFARFARPLLDPHGYGLAPLQDTRVQALLVLPDDQLLLEMRLLSADGKLLGGADALIYLGREIWWAWPLWGAAHLPGMRVALRALYCWIASRRHCRARVRSAGTDRSPSSEAE